MLGERLTELRKKRGLTQQVVADQLHITRSTYAQYEINRRVPEYATLEKMADFFGESIDFLVGRNIAETDPTKEQTSFVIKEMIEKYNIDLSDKKEVDKLEQLVKIVFDEKRNTKDN